MNTSIPPATTPVRLFHPGSDHIPAGDNVAILDRALISNSVDAGCSVTVHDPYVPEYPGVDISHELSDVVRGADVVAILTGHDEYFSLDTGVLKGLMGQERPVVVDGRNVVDADGFIGAGFVYKGIGRGDRNKHLINYHS